MHERHDEPAGRLPVLSARWRPHALPGDAHAAQARLWTSFFQYFSAVTSLAHVTSVTAASLSTTDYPPSDTETACVNSCLWWHEFDNDDYACLPDVTASNVITPTVLLEAVGASESTTRRRTRRRPPAGPTARALAATAPGAVRAGRRVPKHRAAVQRRQLLHGLLPVEHVVGLAARVCAPVAQGASDVHDRRDGVAGGSDVARRAVGGRGQAAGVRARVAGVPVVPECAVRRQGLAHRRDDAAHGAGVPGVQGRAAGPRVLSRQGHLHLPRHGDVRSKQMEQRPARQRRRAMRGALLALRSHEPKRAVHALHVGVRGRAVEGDLLRQLDLQHPDPEEWRHGRRHPRGVVPVQQRDPGRCGRPPAPRRRGAAATRGPPARAGPGRAVDAAGGHVTADDQCFNDLYDFRTDLLEWQTNVCEYVELTQPPISVWDTTRTSGFSMCSDLSTTDDAKKSCCLLARGAGVRSTVYLGRTSAGSCAGDYTEGSTRGTVCCGQATTSGQVVAQADHTCPVDTPKCSGYVSNAEWGSCTGFDKSFIGSVATSGVGFDVGLINNDAHVDIIVGNLVYFGDGTGDFEHAPHLQLGGEELKFVKIVQVDGGDGLDVLTIDVVGQKRLYTQVPDEYNDGETVFEMQEFGTVMEDTRALDVTQGGHHGGAGYRLHCSHPRLSGIVAINSGSESRIYFPAPGTCGRSTSARGGAPTYSGFSYELNKDGVVAGRKGAWIKWPDGATADDWLVVATGSGEGRRT